jgi:acetyl esterase/lipase
MPPPGDTGAGFGNREHRLPPRWRHARQIHSGHWRSIAKLADSCGRPVHVPTYGLAPQHTAREAHDFLSALFERVSATGPTYVIGDSSGGGLALAATQAWVESGGVPPTGLTLIAPWLDIALRNPDIERVAPCDPGCAPRDSA